jgi:hypothetical protein
MLDTIQALITATTSWWAITARNPRGFEIKLCIEYE